MNIIYEDNHLLVAEKPYGVPSQADETGDADMLSLCKAYIGEKYAKPGKVYLGLVHRLDRPTGGVMVFARTSKAAARLTEQIQSGLFEKIYLAVLTGAPPESAGTLRHFLVKDEAAHIARIAEATTEGAKKSGTGIRGAGAEGRSLFRAHPAQDRPIPPNTRSDGRCGSQCIRRYEIRRACHKSTIGAVRLPGLLQSPDDWGKTMLYRQTDKIPLQPL